MVLPEGEPTEEFYEGLEANREFISEVLTPQRLNTDSGLKIKEVGSRAPTPGALRNALLKESSEDLTLFISTASVLEEDFIEELLEAYSSSSADIVFPNLILSFRGGEEVKNYSDPYGSELSLVASLAIEEHLPQWGILVDRRRLLELGGFNEELGDFEFYEFLYRNLKALTLKLSELSYLKQEVRESFVDTSFRSYVLREVVLKSYDWRGELFPFLSWDSNESAALATAYTIVAERLTAYLDLFNASDYLREALLKFHNQESLRRLLNVYRLMGLFDEVKRLLMSGQLLKAEEAERELLFTSQVEKMVEELERAVEEGNLEEALKALIDVSAVYEGAPIYNILGVINWLTKQHLDAYRFFFKAVTMNPLNRDYLFNLTQTARELSREGEVKALINRLLGGKDVH